MKPEPITFTFNGRTLVGQQGDSVATALLRNGVRVFDRSIKRRRKRGPGCLAGFCMNCLLEVDGAPNFITCRTPLRSGAVICSQVARPSPTVDVEAPLRRVVFRLFGDDVYYRLFVRPSWVHRPWIGFLARSAGRGRLPFDDEPPAPLPFTTVETDVLVVGAGVAGVAAANQACQMGARVLLVDRGRESGGWWARWRALGMAPEDGVPDSFSAEVARDVRHLPEMTLVGLYEDRSALALGAERAYRVRYQIVVLATGCYPRLLAFPGSDEPLHLPVQGLIRAALENGWTPASAVLLEAGIQDAPWREALASLGVTVESRKVDVQQGTVLEGFRAQSNGRQGGVKLASGELLTGEVVSWSAGWRPREELVRQAGGNVIYHPARDSFLPERWRHVFVADNVLVAGGCAGVAGFERARRHGQLAGAVAAGQQDGTKHDVEIQALVTAWERDQQEEGA